VKAANTPVIDKPVENLPPNVSRPGGDAMRAVIQDAYGSTDVLRLADIDRPEILANEVLVKVAAAGMDRGTWHSMAGKPYLMRIIGFGFRRPKNRVPGLDVAGTVVASAPR
jgi:NADPH:quinone reductase-like Zn-dependent oxidoreductase